MSVKLHNHSRDSLGSSSSGNHLSRQNTMSSSYEGSRSARQSKRYSMSALYMSMSANEGELQIEDELAKGTMPSIQTSIRIPNTGSVKHRLIHKCSPKNPP